MSESSGKPSSATNRARKGKFSKRKGGKKSFVTSVDELNSRDKIEAEREEARRRRKDGDDNDDGDDDGEDDEEGFSDMEEEGEEQEERVVKSKGVEGLIMTKNLNAIKPQNKVIKAKDMNQNFEQKLSRREREALDKEKSAAEYRRRHLAGETAEARRDLERLKLIRRKRDDSDLRKKEEEEVAKERKAKEKKASSKANEEALDARAIKQMKPSVIKDKLSERGLSTQGQKKELIQRLIDYENEKDL